MDAIECLRSRRSVRKFLDVPLEWDKISTILDCGRLAPSAGNLQNWKFIVVTEKDLKDAVAHACVQQLWVAGAAAIITIVAEPEKAKRFYGMRGERLYTVQSCAAAAENMLVSAHALGVGGCWIGAFDEELLKTALGLPVEIRPQVVLAFGYADEKPVKPKKYPLEVVTYRKHWRGRAYDTEKVLGWYSPKVERALKRTVDLIKVGPEKLREHATRLSARIREKLSQKKNKGTS